MKTKIDSAYIKSPDFLKETQKVPKITKKYLTNGQYLTAVNPKTSLFLHHTAGMTAMGAWQWWNQTPDTIGVAYIIDRNGDIFECFDPKGWAFHLGVHGDGNHVHEKASVAIEIVSAGHLQGDKGTTFMPLFPNKAGSVEVNEDEILRLDTDWRGHKTFHAYTDVQILSLCQLIGQIKSNFKTIELPKAFSEKDLEFNPDVLTKDLKGLFSHTTVRKDKDDIFPQPNLIEALDALMKNLK